MPAMPIIISSAGPSPKKEWRRVLLIPDGDRERGDEGVIWRADGADIGAIGWRWSGRCAAVLVIIVGDGRNADEVDIAAKRRNVVIVFMVFSEIFVFVVV